jgi:ABC-type sugar transport system ATPase subunit
LFESSREDSKLYIKNSNLHLPAPLAGLPALLLVGIRPEDVKPDPAGQFTGKVALTEPLGVETILHIKTGDQTLLSLVPGMTPLRLGDEVRFNIVQEKLHCFGMDKKRINS